MSKFYFGKREKTRPKRLISKKALDLSQIENYINKFEKIKDAVFKTELDGHKDTKSV